MILFALYNKTYAFISPPALTIYFFLPCDCYTTTKCCQCAVARRTSCILSPPEVVDNSWVARIIARVAIASQLLVLKKICQCAVNIWNAYFLFWITINCPQITIKSCKSVGTLIALLHGAINCINTQLKSTKRAIDCSYLQFLVSQHVH